MAYTTINKSTEHFNTNLYTGNGSTQHSITGVGFQPDLVWIKSRDDAYNHFWFDAVRGAGKQIYSNTTAVEATNLNNLYSFNADGFSLAQSGNDDVTNKNSSNFASWNWKAGGAGSANTDGYINSTVSANTTAGFSIVTYTGSGTGNQTVGHGLGVKPRILLIKCRTGGAESWYWWQDTSGNGTADQRLLLSGTQTNYNNYFASFQNTTFTLPTQNDTGWNGSGNTYVAYCFAEKTGYSKSLKWASNNNSDGAFLYTGFTPSFFLFKAYDTTRGWNLIHNKSPGYNVIDKVVNPNLNIAESDTNGIVDFVSNGIKFRTDGSDFAGTYNFVGFAIGQTMVGTNNIPCTAR